MLRISSVFSCLIGALLSAGSLCAIAQPYPAKPIRIVVPVSAGGPPDLAARLLAPRMSAVLAQPVLVENKPGVGGLIAFEYVAKQVPADGYTLALGVPALVTFPIFQKDIRFDPQKDLPPISLLAEGQIALVGPSSAPWNTFGEMIQFAKANPGRLNFGTPGLLSPPTLQMEAIKQRHGIDVIVVAYKGGQVDTMPAIIANDIQLAVSGEALAASLLSDKKVKVLAVTGSRRSESLPGVPTFSELGHPEILGFWLTLNAPGQTPRVAIEKLYAAAATALNSSEVKEALRKVGLETVGSTPEVAVKRSGDAVRFYTEIARKVGLKPQ